MIKFWADVRKVFQVWSDILYQKYLQKGIDTESCRLTIVHQMQLTPCF